MTNREDLDWLYGREPSPDSDTSRPRVETAAYSTQETPTPSAARYPAQQPRTTSASERRRARERGHRQIHSSTQPPKRRRRRRKGGPLRLVGALLTLWVIYLVVVPLLALGSMSTVAQSQAATLEPQPGTAVLLIGTDSRDGLSEQQKGELGTGDAEGSRADTILMLYRPPQGRSVLISLPRDSYVPINGYGRDKLNAAYAYGGAPLLIDTVQNVTGVQIDGYLEIGFGGFASAVDAVGGIEVCPEEPMVDERANLDLQPGCQTINGAQALGYVRTRYYDAEGDIGRGARQREVIGKVVSKIASPATFINPVRYWQLNQSMAGLLTRGDQTGPVGLANAGLALRNVSSGDGISLVVPIADPAGWPETGASVVIWDSEQAIQLFHEISIGDTSGLDRFVR